ncbi:MAG: DNA recombination protein RmuC [Bacteroidetes bacterium]|nr:DNA recombination protein RmuC [Bacteroidota bacterium]
MKDNRAELGQTLKDFKIEIADLLKSIAEQNRLALESINKTLETKVDSLIDKTEKNTKENREELSKNIKEFAESNALQLDKTTAIVDQRLKELNEQAKKENAEIREALLKLFKAFQEQSELSFRNFNEMQREKFTQLENRQTELIQTTEKKLEQMRETVDEKLQKTLNERISQSFEIVGKQLENVQKGLVEMQTLASDVGGLKKVLSNVKLRGGIGEVQLAMLLEQILAPDQYEANVRTKKSSQDIVEFAIKLPGRDEEGSIVYLPIDAKFPKDAYEQLVDAYEVGDIEKVEAASKNMENVIKKMAKDISDKYLDPPHTTDFAIMFLPFEGIYAEVIRRSILMEQLQKDYKVIVTGPTTLAAILNSFQMGFRVLTLQKRSSEVWKVLGAVKNEFEKFGGMLEKAQKNIQTADKTLEDLLGTRTRAINRTLKNIDKSSASDAQLMLPDIGSIIDPEEEII